MSLAELRAEKEAIEAAIEARQGRERDSVMKKIESIASKSGFELGDLFGASSPSAGEGAVGKKKRATKKARGKRVSKAKGRKVPPKYRNPDDPTQTWAGRGRQPRWYAEAVAAGRSDEELAA